MQYPRLPVQSASRQTVDAFRGYNHNLRISDGEFYDMRNMTSDDYPVLSPRGKRGVYAAPENVQAMIAKDSLCYVDGTAFVINGYRVEMGLSTEAEDCPKRLVSMGAYVIILPDKKWVNTLDTTENGNMEASVTTSTDVSFSLCRIDGDEYQNVTVSATEPEEPENLALWMDTSTTPHALKQYTEASAMWVTVASTYVKISATGIGKPFETYDGVTISGVLDETLADLNASMVILAKGDDYIVVAGILDAAVTQPAEDGAVTVKREMPEMDYVIESENRLWGCRYGVAADGQVVNEIYASKLGDFKNWNCFMGVSTDSYAASCGTDGPFTGAITHLGYPLFFKENFVHKVYGNYPANFQIQTTACRGVQNGCDRSLAIVNEVLYYKARSGICVYDGSLPTECSYVLGNEAFGSAVAGGIGNKYYVSMEDGAGNWHLFVYDTAKQMWHKEDGLHVKAFCACRGELYAIQEDTGKILTMLSPGEEPAEDNVEWMAQTGEIGISTPDMKYISRINLRLSLEIGAKLDISAQYDLDSEWVNVGTLYGTSLRSFSIPIRPRRCDYMKLRLSGYGGMKLYAITKTIQQGSDLS